MSMEMLKNCWVLSLLLLIVLASGKDTVDGDYEVGLCNHRPEIVSRAEWRARQPIRTSMMSLPVSHAIIIHTVTRTCDTKPKCILKMQAIQDYHIDFRGFWDIAYNFLIGMDGRVYVGHDWNLTGSHSINYNTNSIGVAFIGNFSEKVPTPASMAAVQQLFGCGVRFGFLTPSFEVHGHKDVACLDSPGEMLYRIIRTWNNYKGGRMPDYNCNNH